MTAPAYRFEQSAAPGAWLVFDAATGQRVHGSVFENIGGDGFTYEKGRWNGQCQVRDSFRAPTLDELSEHIARAALKTPRE